MTRETKTILVGTSLELASDTVVRSGAELARRSGAKLYLFHAHSLPVAYFAGPTGMTTISPDLLETEREVREQLLAEQLDRVGLAADVVAGSVIEAGAPHRMLLETAAKLDADLVVVGARESTGRLLHGTTTDRVLRKTTCPVWVLHGEAQLPPRRILAPVDLSPLSEESLRRGLELIDHLHGDAPPEVELLFVLTPEELEGSSQFTPEQIERLAHEELKRLSERLDRGDRLRSKLRVGDIRDEILAEIAERPTDLIVLGTHGRSGFERFLLGSVASDLASRAPCDALVIPPQEAEE